MLRIWQADSEGFAMGLSWMEIVVLRWLSLWGWLRDRLVLFALAAMAFTAA